MRRMFGSSSMISKLGNYSGRSCSAVDRRESALCLLGLQLRGAALRLGDAFDFDGDRLDGLLDTLKPRDHIGGRFVRRRRLALEATRKRPKKQKAKHKDQKRREEHPHDFHGLRRYVGI